MEEEPVRCAATGAAFACPPVAAAGAAFACPPAAVRCAATAASSPHSEPLQCLGQSRSHTVQVVTPGQMVAPEAGHRLRRTNQSTNCPFSTKEEGRGNECRAPSRS